jgi:hypothetical protein
MRQNASIVVLEYRANSIESSHAYRCGFADVLERLLMDCNRLMIRILLEARLAHGPSWPSVHGPTMKADK